MKRYPHFLDVLVAGLFCLIVWGAVIGYVADALKLWHQ